MRCDSVPQDSHRWQAEQYLLSPLCHDARIVVKVVLFYLAPLSVGPLRGYQHGLNMNEEALVLLGEFVLWVPKRQRKWNWAAWAGASDQCSFRASICPKSLFSHLVNAPICNQCVILGTSKLAAE